MPAAGLIALLRTPTGASGLSGAEWSAVMAQGRRLQMLGQLAERLARAGQGDVVPAAAQRHLALAMLNSERRAQAAQWEVQGLRRVVEPGVPLVLLKGCAYALCGDANAPGRNFSDVDVLVPKAALASVEVSLIAVGWKPSELSAYDVAYYRNWMHELPPMTHVRRNTTVDLHHAINPPVSRCHVRTELLLPGLVEIRAGIFSLAPLDRVIHCAIHLVQEGDATKLLRDLYDLYLLSEQHCGGAAAKEHLLVRAAELGVAPQVRAAVEAARGVFTSEPAVGGWLSACLRRAAIDSLSEGASWIAQWPVVVLLAYSHWIKMPARLLVPHLLRKAWLGLRGKDT